MAPNTNFETKYKKHSRQRCAKLDFKKKFTFGGRF